MPRKRRGPESTQDPDTRGRMVAGAVLLLATKGLQATSFSEVLEATGAPRGSLYHHFPGGKDELVGAALEVAGQRALALLDEWAGRSTVELTASFLGVWRHILVRSQFRAGCAVVAVTVASDSAPLLERTARIFHAWRTRLAELYVLSGVVPEQAARFAATIVAASEGAVVLSRAEQSLAPFELVAEQLVEQARAVAKKRAT